MLVGSESLGQVKTESEECVLALSGVACAAAMMEFAAIELWIAMPKEFRRSGEGDFAGKFSFAGATGSH